MILSCQPYRGDKDLGRSYNECFNLIGDDDYLLITDYDVLILLPEQINHIKKYAELHPEGDLFVCYTNRIHESGPQIYNGAINPDPDIKNHIAIADQLTSHLYKVTRLYENISGFLMLIPKRTWDEIKFKEGIKCLGVDTKFSQDLLKANKIIYRMEGIYVWHTYRLINGIKDKSHLL